MGCSESNAFYLFSWKLQGSTIKLLECAGFQLQNTIFVHVFTKIIYTFFWHYSFHGWHLCKATQSMYLSQTLPLQLLCSYTLTDFDKCSHQCISIGDTLCFHVSFKAVRFLSVTRQKNYELLLRKFNLFWLMISDSKGQHKIGSISSIIS